MRLRSIITGLIGCTVFAASSAAQEASPQDGPTLKQRYLEALSKPLDNSDLNFINYAALQSAHLQNIRPVDMSTIIVSLHEDNLHLDPDIQKALIAIREHHPVTSARLSASRALAPVNPFGLRGLTGNEAYKEINKKRDYCTAESVGAKPIATVPDALLDDLTPIYDYGIHGQDFNNEKIQGVDIFAKDVSGGWLTGYGNIPKLGLHYIPRDRSLDTQQLMAGTIHAIIEKDNSDSVLVISNDMAPAFQGRLCPSSLKVSEVTETAKGKFSIKLLKVLPHRVKSVTQLDNGDMFINFGTECFFYASNGITQDQHYFNPPIGLTPSGLIYDICEKDSTTKRW